jgi:hypothetical protein
LSCSCSLLWFLVWCLTPFSTIFQLYRGIQVYWRGNRSTRRKPQTYRKSLKNFITYCCIEYTSPLTGFDLTTLVVIDTDCTGSCKSNYNTSMTTALWFLIQFGFSVKYGSFLLFYFFFLLTLRHKHNIYTTSVKIKLILHSLLNRPEIEKLENVLLFLPAYSIRISGVLSLSINPYSWATFSWLISLKIFTSYKKTASLLNI